MKKIYLISCLMMLAACYKPSDYDPQPNNPNLIGIKPMLSDLPANGASVDTLIVTLPINSDPGKRSVALTASAGTFVSGNAATLTVSVDNTDPKYPDKRVAIVPFKSIVQTGAITITGTLLTNTTTATINLTTDIANKIHVEADKIVIVDAQETNITAVLSQSKSGLGIPSAGQQVFFLAATDSLGKNPKGYFRAIKDKTDATGTATAVYASELGYKGPLYIISKFARGVKDTITSKCLIIKN